MPTVGRVTNPSLDPSGATGVRLNIRASESEMGGELAQGLGSLGGAVTKYAQEEKTKADSLAVTAADSALADWETDFLYNPQEGALNAKGRDAFGLPDTAMESYQTKLGEIEQNLANDEQRLAFRQLAETRRKDLDRTVQRHVASEYEAYDQNATSAALQNSVQAAAANYGDPERIERELTRQRTYIMAQAERNGEAGEVTQMRLNDAASVTHIAVIDQMLASRDYQSAQAYYEGNRDTINGTDRDEIEESIRTSRLRGESQAKADQYLSEGKTRTEALADARAIEDPDLRDNTVNRVNSRYDEVEQIREETRRQNIQMAVDGISNGGSVDDIDPSTWNSFDRETRANLRALEARGEWYQDDQRWYEFIQKPPSEVRNMNLYSELRPYVDDQHWDRALAYQQELQGDAASPELTATLTFRQRFENTMATAVFDDISDLNKTEQAQFAQMENEAANRIQLAELDKGRKLLPSEIQGVIDEMVLETVNLGSGMRWNDDVVPAASVLEDDRGDAYVPMEEIPQADQDAIRNMILSNNQRVSNRKIESAYAAYVMGDFEAFNRATSE